MPDFADECAFALKAASIAAHTRQEKFTHEMIAKIIREHCIRKPVARAPRRPAGIPPEAEVIYEAYPRHVGRTDALKAIAQALRVVPAGDLLALVKAYRAATNRWSLNDRTFIPHPATWFNQGRYNDDQREWVRGGLFQAASSAPVTSGTKEPEGWRDALLVKHPSIDPALLAAKAWEDIGPDLKADAMRVIRQRVEANA